MEQSALREIALLFLKLGTLGFGGPAAHIALMEAEVVQRRRWLSRQDFLDLVGATNLIPGPNSTELAIHIGYRRAGFPGLLVAGISFIVPAATLVCLIAWAYVRYQSLPEIDVVFRSVKPLIVLVVLQALSRLTRTAIKSITLGTVAICSIVLNLAGVNELAVLFFAAFASWVAARLRPRAALMSSVELMPLFVVFLKAGSVLFGSGYVLLAFLRSDLVERFHWLSSGQLLDAVAVGQVTPGPVFTTATFIGYVLAGTPGAIIATVGIFLPAFVFVALSGLFIPKIRRSRAAGVVLDGVNAGSLALMAVVTVQLAATAVVDVPTALVAVAGFVGIFLIRMNSLWLIAGAALAGIVSHSLLS